MFNCSFFYKKLFAWKICLLTHFMPLVSFYTPWKHQKISVFRLVARNGLRKIQSWFLIITLHKICENTGHWKPVFSHILCTVSFLYCLINISQITKSTSFHFETSLQTILLCCFFILKHGQIQSQMWWMLTLKKKKERSQL